MRRSYRKFKWNEWNTSRKSCYANGMRMCLTTRNGPSKVVAVPAADTIFIDRGSRRPGKHAHFVKPIHHFIIIRALHFYLQHIFTRARCSLYARGRRDKKKEREYIWALGPDACWCFLLTAPIIALSFPMGEKTFPNCRNSEWGNWNYHKAAYIKSMKGTVKKRRRERGGGMSAWIKHEERNTASCL